MRRSILVSVLVGALVGLAAAAGISLAGSGGSSSSDGSASESKGSFQAAYASKQGNRPGNGNRHGGRRGGHRPGHGMGFGPLAIAFRGLADRLGVTKEQLHEATLGVKKRALDRAVADGTITQGERDALESCNKAHGKKRSGCDRAKARAAHRKLHRAIKQRVKTDASGLKTQVLEDLAAELPGDKTAAEIDAAARAELEALLDKGVMLGLVTEKGRALALGCWDKPNECDRAALRAEVKKRLRGHGQGGRKGGRRGSHP